MIINAQFDVKPLLIIPNDSFSNKSILDGSQLLLFENKIPDYISDEDGEDKLLNWLCGQIYEIQKCNPVPFLLVKQNLLAPLHKNSGIRLISHIRLSTDEKLHQLPIIILTDTSNDLLSPKNQYDWENLAPLYSKGVKFTPEQDKEKKYAKNDSLLIQEIERLYFSLVKDGKSEIDQSQFTDYETPAIPVPRPDGSNHQVTNDWGAYRLIQASGLTPTHNYREHLYFKYLQSSSVVPQPVDNSIFSRKINKNLRVLLIDDNYYKGWKNSIEEILSKCLLAVGFTVKVDSYEYADDITSLLVSEYGKCQIDDYDLIYLDLILPKNLQNRGNAVMENGINVLTKIKEYNPVLPIIMFTASTKATNMDSIYELGVDGYFVKEHPDARNDGSFSKKNLESFVNTTYNCFEKGVLLKSYWVRTQKIRKNNTIREQLISVNRTTELTKFADRIPERLEMFVGIMKKAFEQTSFDKTKFYYDQYETAFLTLWSSLNDSVAAYYERNATTSHRNFQWKDKFTGQVYVDFVGGNMVSPLVYDTNNSPYFSVTTDSNGNLSQIVTPPKVNYQTTLSNQIAFLLYSICEKYRIDLQEKDKYYKILKEANDIRNSLWLTHSELLSTNYLNNFKRTLKTDRVAGNKNEAFWRKEISKLFSLIEFIVSEK